MSGAPGPLSDGSVGIFSLEKPADISTSSSRQGRTIGSLYIAPPPKSIPGNSHGGRSVYKVNIPALGGGATMRHLLKVEELGVQNGVQQGSILDTQDTAISVDLGICSAALPGAPRN